MSKNLLTQKVIKSFVPELSPKCFSGFLCSMYICYEHISGYFTAFFMGDILCVLQNLLYWRILFLNSLLVKPQVLYARLYFWVEVKCSFAEVYVDSFYFWELEAIFIGPLLYLKQFCICLSSVGMFGDEGTVSAKNTSEPVLDFGPERGSAKGNYIWH